MSDLNQPGVPDGVGGDAVQGQDVDRLEGDVDLPDEGDVAGAPEEAPGGLGRTPMPPD